MAEVDLEDKTAVARHRVSAAVITEVWMDRVDLQTGQRGPPTPDGCMHMDQIRIGWFRSKSGAMPSDIEKLSSSRCPREDVWKMLPHSQGHKCTASSKHTSSFDMA